MACDLLMPSQAGAGNPAFSPLTLFECTITNAQMLIDSMADRDLFQALKIAGSLHTHIVGVIEPRYDRVCQRSDEHEACCQAAASATPSKSSAPPSQPLPHHQQGNIAGENGGDTKSSQLQALKSEQVGVKSELLDADAFPEEEEEDCLILEEDSSFAAAAAGPAGIPLSPSASSSASRKRSRPLSPSALMAGAGASSSASSSLVPGAGFPGSAQQLSECKNALRLAYKNIKGNGPHLFDFSLSFHDPANQRVSEQIISLARQQMAHLRLPNDVWWNCCFPSVYTELTKYDKHRERMKHRMRARRLMHSKLARRQKSFELLATSLSTDKFDKYRIILSRDYTSSDEEADPGSSTGDDSGGGGGGALRVRELPWESAELREMKAQLDSIYLENCATQKQAQQLRNTVRDSSCVSGRTPPANCPSWALAEEYR